MIGTGKKVLSQRQEGFNVVFVILWTSVCWRLKSEAGGSGDAALKKSENLFTFGLRVRVGSGQLSLSPVIITPV